MLLLTSLRTVHRKNIDQARNSNIYTIANIYILNNINIETGKLFCEDGKVYYTDIKKCVDKRDSKKSPKKSPKKEEDKEDEKLSIKERIKQNLKKKKVSCPDDKIYNRFTNNCVNLDSPSGIFLSSKYGKLDSITKEQMNKFNKLKRTDLDKLCEKYKIGCDFNTKEELIKHILNNINIDTDEFFCKDNKIYYDDIKRCVNKRSKKEDKSKKTQKDEKKDEKKDDNNKIIKNSSSK